MKNYEKLKELKSELFKRLTGVKSDTLKEMLQVCEAYHKQKKSKGGKPNKLSEPTASRIIKEIAIVNKIDCIIKLYHHRSLL